MKFEDFKKSLKGIEYKSGKDWEIFLPYSARHDDVKKVIEICRNHLMVNWHLNIPEPTPEIPEPEIKMWWEKSS